MLATIYNTEKFGLRFDVVDDLTGRRLGRAKSATYRTADVVGLDTFAHVAKTMEDNLPEESVARVFQHSRLVAGADCQRRARLENESRHLQKRRQAHHDDRPGNGRICGFE